MRSMLFYIEAARYADIHVEIAIERFISNLVNKHPLRFTVRCFLVIRLALIEFNFIVLHRDSNGTEKDSMQLLLY